MIRNITPLAMMLAIMAMTLAAVAGPTVERLDKDAEGLGWKLGTQAYTFNRYTFFEAVDKAAEAGLKYIEIFPGQKIGDGVDGNTHHSASPAARKAILDKVKSKGIRLMAYGVVNGNNDEDWTNIFTFAKEMGIQTVVCEPKFEALDLLEKLAEETKINVALHNHPKPSIYWDPAIVLKQLEGRSKRMGACADTGHWRRSGLDSLECLKKLEGRIKTLHFKDLVNDGQGPHGWHDAPWGTGDNNVPALLAELKRQGFKGLFSFEYEWDWETSLPAIKQSVTYFDLVAASLVEDGFKPLFKKDLSNAIYEEGGWTTHETSVCTNGKSGDIWTQKRYADFILDLEFNCHEKSVNSGVFVRTDSIQDWLNTAIEIQVLQGDAGNPKHNVGAIFDVLAPFKPQTIEVDAWNRFQIMARDNMVYVTLNGQATTALDLNLWTEAGKNPDGSKNKFKYAYKDLAREGHIGLQGHGNPICFRNAQLKVFK